MNYSIRLLLAIFVWLAASFIAMNNIAANETALDAWWLPLLLFLLGAALLLIRQLRIGLTPEMEAEAEAAIAAAQPRPLLPVPDVAVAPIAPTETEVPPLVEDAAEAAAEAEEEVVAEPEAAAEVAEVETAPAKTDSPKGRPTPEPEPEGSAPEMTTTANRSVSQKTSERVQSDKPDDLTRIEGIGPKMSRALIAAGFDTFAKVAAASEDELRAAIETAGMRFSPSLVTWATQATYAANADWDGLATYQSTLTAGRPPEEG